MDRGETAEPRAERCTGHLHEGKGQGKHLLPSLGKSPRGGGTLRSWNPGRPHFHHPALLSGDPSEQLVRHFLIETGPKGVKIKGCPTEPYFGEKQESERALGVG